MSEKEVHGCLQSGIYHGEDDHAQVAYQWDKIDDEEESEQWGLQLWAVSDDNQNELSHHCEVVSLHPG